MKTIHCLNNHTMQELLDALCAFFSSLEMETDITDTDSTYTVKAKNNASLCDSIYGGRMSCAVTLVEDGNGNVRCNIGGGSWLDKGLGIGAVAFTLTFPAVTATAIMLAAGTAIVGSNTVSQASLPKKVDSYICEFLSSSPSAALSAG